MTLINRTKKAPIENDTKLTEDVKSMLENASPALDSSLEQGSTDNYVELVPETTFTDPEDEQLKAVGNTTGLQDPYKNSGFTPAVEVSKKGFKGEDLSNQLDKQTHTEKKKTARPASEVDLSKLDESMILNMPEIKAVSFELIDMLNPIPKDKGIRFKWANYKNNVAGNLGRYLAIGFSYASPADVDDTKYTLDPSMIEGNQIHYYDVVLLKIDVIRLMQLYKTNIIRSIMKMGRAAERGKNEAERQFNADLASSPDMMSRYNQAKQAMGGQSPIEFYTPGMEESRVVGK